jgi:pSer/pThr/pTyr-binding forkhead associated (FHA) protein
MKLSIVVLTPGPAEGKVIPIHVPQFLIGRDPGCQLRPGSILISKRHFALLRRVDKVFVRDFGSTNGTFINDRQIKGEIELIDGDRLRIGPLTFAVELKTVPVDRPTPLPLTNATTQRQAAGLATSPLSVEPTRAASAEDEAAPTLLAMQDSDAPDAGSQTDVPEGSTQFDLPMLNAAGKEEANQEKEKPKQPSGDTSSAAKSILDKYLKRPRTS